VTKFQVKEVIKNDDGTLKVITQGGEVIDQVNKLIWAIGRTPLTKQLKLDSAGIKTDQSKNIIVDAYQNTSRPGIYALGDVCGRYLLTPGIE
jgi:glutathione reductase (NADPH)